MFDLCLYHSDEDGFCSAWVASKYIDPGADLVAVNYGQDPPDVKGRRVLVVDFSYKRPVLEAMKADAAALQVIDHHKSARDELAGLTYCDFDMGHSGAQLTLRWFEQERLADLAFHMEVQRRWTTQEEEPVLPRQMQPVVDYVEDRDLWRFQLPDSKAVNNVIALAPFRLGDWDRLAYRLEFERADVVREGLAIEAYKQRLCAQIIERTKVDARIGDHDVPCVNTAVLYSETMEALRPVDAPFTAYYYDRADGQTVVGLRTAGELDVSEVAGAFGGGGHKAAAGFQCSRMLSFDGVGCPVFSPLELPSAWDPWRPALATSRGQGED